MIFKLSEIDKGKPSRVELNIDPHSIGDPSFSTEVEVGSLSVSIQDHPGGYFLKFNLHAKVQSPCSSCGQLMSFEINSQGGIGLRLEHPQEQHVVLRPDEMDVRFLKDPEVDLLQFFDEQVELEMPQFPRHERVEQCTITVLPFLERDSDEGLPKNSPFAVLNSLLEKDS